MLQRRAKTVTAPRTSGTALGGDSRARPVSRLLSEPLPAVNAASENNKDQVKLTSSSDATTRSTNADVRARRVEALSSAPVASSSNLSTSSSSVKPVLDDKES